MLRVALTIYLGISLLAGPALCCCTLTRTAAAVTQAVAKNTNGVQERSCPCCKQTSDAESPSQGSQHEAPGRESCPCQSSHPQLAQIDAPAGFALQGNAEVWFDAMVGHLEPSLWLITSTSARADFSHPFDDPFHSAQDLLRVMHQLRC